MRGEHARRTWLNSPEYWERERENHGSDRRRLSCARPRSAGGHVAVYQRQVESATKLPLRAIQRELEKLSQIGLIYQWKEGNRTWYQIDQNHPFVPILQSLILKVCSPIDRLRTTLHTNKSIRLALFNPEKNEVLVVTTNGETFPETIEGIRIFPLTTNAFTEKIEQKNSELLNFITGAVDLLGNREDFLWRIIENNQINIPKGENVL